MLTLGTETGSLINHLLSSIDAPVPVVGMGCTIHLWTDRHAATVIAVSASGKTATIQRDHATRTDTNGMSEAQQYAYTPDPDGSRYTVRLTRRGWRISTLGCSVGFGYRREYHDYSF